MRLVLALLLSAGSVAWASDAPAPAPAAAPAVEKTAKSSPADALAMLKAGNERFVTGQYASPHREPARRELAVKDGQAKHAIATVLTCSDSRVPPEHIFDAGIMDLFVIRVAGNPANADEIASIEYGLAHVNTPVLVVLGHSHCGAITAAVGLSAPRKEGEHGHALEPNIVPLVNGLVPAVQNARRRDPKATDEALINLSIEENVWLAIENLLRRSEVARKKVLDGSVIIAPAIYDLATGKIRWLSESKVFYYLGKLERDTVPAAETRH